MHKVRWSVGIAPRLAVCILAASIVGVASDSQAQPAGAPGTGPAVTYLPQGWTADDRDTFYTTGQGSHLMPFSWFKALRRLDADAPFAADQLQRYGYLRNDSPKNTDGLPVGFVVEKASGQLGMTCAACHTGQLEYVKGGITTVLRIDGAPASSADFQQFLTDLADAASNTLAQPGRFDGFAKAVLGGNYSDASAAQLKSAFGAWVSQFNDFMSRSLPTAPWGPGRLDAFGMIFNRVAGRDLGQNNNFRVADAPVSYPFLWNASRQDHTQWNGAVPNGLYIQAMARNTGEVLGVFADFAPKPGIIPTVINYGSNSADFNGLEALEEKIAILKPPPWPVQLFGLDSGLVAKGQVLFEHNCGRCHDEQTSTLAPDAWVTPVDPVKTDPRMFNNSLRTSNPGIYTGQLLPPPKFGVFSDPAATDNILASSVIGCMFDNLATAGLQSGVRRALQKDLAGTAGGSQLLDLLSAQITAQIQGIISVQLSNLYIPPSAAGSPAAYEARVLHGIWATAPYLHNGSVPNLWELLKPAKDRISTFMVGSRLFDPKNVGFATDQTPFKSGTFVTDPNNANGNGNGGHEYGTGLTEAERWAIIEYLKQL